MYTSLIGAALALAPAPAAETLAPSWLNDYAQARSLASEKHKPLAVVIGNGGEGWKKLVRGGELDTASNRALATEYVCLYVDTSSEDGAKLAQAMAVPAGPGLVISDRTGGVMAFRHKGELNQDDLGRALVRYADPNFVAKTTETVAAPAAPAPVTPIYYVPMQSSGGCPNCR